MRNGIREGVGEAGASGSGERADQTVSLLAMAGRGKEKEVGDGEKEPPGRGKAQQVVT